MRPDLTLFLPGSSGNIVVLYPLFCQDSQYLLTQDGQNIVLYNSMIPYILSCQDGQYLLTQDKQSLFMW